AAKLLRTRIPGGVPELIGLGFVAGIGFTMSLFIGALAFTDPSLAAPVRVGVYAGSILSAIMGLIVLSQSLRRTARNGKGPDETRPFIAPEAAYEEMGRPKFD